MGALYRWRPVGSNESGHYQPLYRGPRCCSAGLPVAVVKGDLDTETYAPLYTIEQMANWSAFIERVLMKAKRQSSSIFPSAL